MTDDGVKLRDEDASGSNSPVKRALLEMRRLRAESEALRQAHSAPVAIIGMALRLPGAIVSPEALWQALLEGRDLISEVPGERWEASLYRSPVPGPTGHDALCTRRFPARCRGVRCRIFRYSATRRGEHGSAASHPARACLGGAGARRDQPAVALRYADWHLPWTEQQRLQPVAGRAWRGDRCLHRSWCGDQYGGWPAGILLWLPWAGRRGRHGLLVVTGSSPSGSVEPAPRRDGACDGWRRQPHPVTGDELEFLSYGHARARRPLQGLQRAGRTAMCGPKAAA